MKVLTVVGIGLCGMAAHLLLESAGRKDIAVLSTIACGMVLILSVAQSGSQTVSTIMNIADQTGMNDPVVRLMLKTTGMALLTEMAAQLCRDVGIGALAQKIELAGKGMILCAALPMLAEFITDVLQLLS